MGLEEFLLLRAATDVVLHGVCSIVAMVVVLAA